MNTIWYDYCMIAISLLSIILPAIVIYVVLYQSPESMVAYKRFIVNFTIFDLLFSLVLGILVRPFPLFPFTGAIINGPLSLLGESGPIVAIVLLVNTAGYAIVAQVACLLYRMAVLRQSEQLLSFVTSTRTWIITYAVKLTCTVGTAFAAVMLQVPQNEIPSRMMNILKFYPDAVIPEIHDEVLLYIDSATDDRAGLGGRLIVLLLLIAEILALSCVYLILHRLDEQKSSFSTNTYKLHRQLTIALGLQISKPFTLFAPFVFIMLPVGYGLIANYYHWDTSELLGEIMVAFIDCYSATNSIITLYCVKAYREYLLSQFKKALRKISCGYFGMEKDELFIRLPESTMNTGSGVK